jgi:Fic family protein
MTMQNATTSPIAVATSTPATPPLGDLRQNFIDRILKTMNTPMDLLPILERVFPPQKTLQATLDQLDDLKRCLDSFRPLNSDQVERLQAVWDTEYTYESNRIEGNTLTLSETSIVINEGMTVAGKTVNEHLEAINHKEAIGYLRAIVDGTEPMSEWTIKSLHELILKNHAKYHEQRGKYRNEDVQITGTTFVPPIFMRVPDLMRYLIEHYEAKQTAQIHPVALAADMHSELVGVHPFIDGNGRTSRLVMNFILMRAGFPIANISGDKTKRTDYYDALNASHLDHNDEPFRLLVAQYVRLSVFKYLAMVSGSAVTENNTTGAYFFEKMNAA